MENKITDAILFRFFDGESTPDEATQILAWLDEGSDANQQQFDNAHELWVLMNMCLPQPTRSTPPIDRSEIFNIDNREIRSIKRRKFFRYAVEIAASLLVCGGMSWAFVSNKVDRIAEAVTTVEAPAGNRTRVHLDDGSVVDINSGGKITYPAVFKGKERRVKIEGEVMLKVASNAKKPFIVETFDVDVKALGTTFNVIANQERNEFSTALLEGEIVVSHHSSKKEIVLKPNTIATLRGDKLVTREIKSMDDYLWPEGIISLGGLTFDEVVEKLERAYNVTIILERETLPTIKYAGLKLPTSDGIGYAMNILQKGSDFTYEYDNIAKIVTIK